MCIQNKDYFVLVLGGEIVAGFELSCNHQYWDDYHIADAYYIHRLVTKLGYYGLGRVALEFCKNLAWFNHKKVLRLDCLKMNSRLNEIYENYHFQLVKSGYDGYYSYNLRECKIYCYFK